MGKIYEKADAEVMSLLHDVIAEYHPELASLDLEIGVTMVTPNVNNKGVVVGSAIMLHGAPAAACIRLVTLKERIHNGLDAAIDIDKERWDGYGEANRRALLDHELTHLVIVRDGDGVMKTHDDMRPKLAMRPDDFTLTGFHEVIERHGKDAIEFQSIKTVTSRWEQQLFDWAGDGSTGSKRGKKAHAA